MRHGIVGNKLGRNSSWRKATVRDIAKATLVRQRIATTKAKAKEARKLVDRLITLGKKGELAHRRRAFAILGDHRIVSDLFNKTASRFKARQGGYTRIIPVSSRRGDNAQMAYLELTEKEELIVSKPKSAATAKKEKPQVKPEGKSAPGAPVKEQQKKSKEAPSTKTEQPQIKEHPKRVEKDTSKKRIVGGFKNIFKRKKPE